MAAHIQSINLFESGEKNPQNNKNSTEKTHIKARKNR